MNNFSFGKYSKDDKYRINQYTREDLSDLVRAEESDDPLVLLRPFLNNLGDRLMYEDKRNIAINSIGYRNSRIFDFYLIDEKKNQTRKISLDFFVDEKGYDPILDELDIKKDNMSDFGKPKDLSLFIDCGKINGQKVPEEIIDLSNLNFIQIHRKDNGFKFCKTGHIKSIIQQKLPLNVATRIDYIIQKFLTGDYDPGKPMVFQKKEKKIKVKNLERKLEIDLTDEKYLQDPLIFFQDCAKVYGLNLLNSERGSYPLAEENEQLEVIQNHFNNKRKLGHGIFCDLYISLLYHGKEKVPDIIKNRLNLISDSLPDAKMSKSDLGISLFFEYIIHDPEKRELRKDDFSAIGNLATLFNEETGIYEFDYDEFKFYHEGSRFLPEFYEDIEEVTKTDFRPYFARTVEIFSGIPRGKWHNPRFYTENLRDDSIEIKNNILELLFSAEERKNLESKLEGARLNMRDGWMSVPRLSLGAIKLPTPGMKDIQRDEFVTKAAPLFVEYLSDMGLMEKKEAQKLMLRKLLNYFIHKSGFQLNSEIAMNIVKRLKGEDILVQKIA